MILSRLLNKNDYGTYRQILYTYNFLLVIFSAGLPRIFSYFLPRHSIGQGKMIVSSITLVLFLSGLIFTAFLYFFSGLIASILKNDALSHALKLFSPVPALLLPTLGIEGIFSTYKRTEIIALYNLITRVLQLLFIILPLIFISDNYEYSIYGWIFSSFISLIIALYFKAIPFRNVTKEQCNLTLKEIFQYSLPIAAASLAAIAIKAADQFFVSRYFGTAVFAEFSNGFIEIPFVGMITGATSAVLMPRFSKIIYETKDKSELVRIWSSALSKSAILIYPMVIFCLFYSKLIMSVLFSSSYAASAKFFSIAVFINFFNVIIFAPLLLSLGKSKFYAELLYGIAFTKWILGFILVSFISNPVSIAVLSAGLSIITTVIAMYYTSITTQIAFFELFPFHLFLKYVIHAVISITPVYLLIGPIISVDSTVVNLLISGIGYLILLLTLSTAFNIDYKSIVSPIIGNKLSGFFRQKIYTNS